MSTDINEQPAIGPDGIAARHEWGKIDSNQPFNIIAVDMSRAYSHLKATLHERMLIDYAREHGWGKSARKPKINGKRAEAEPCPIPVRLLASAWGIPANHLYVARAALVKDSILIQSDEGFLPSKDVCGWPRERISEESVRYAAEGLVDAKQKPKQVRESVLVRDPVPGTELGTSTDLVLGTGSVPSESRFTDQPSPGSRTNLVQVHGPSHIDETGARIEILQIKEDSLKGDDLLEDEPFNPPSEPTPARSMETEADRVGWIVYDLAMNFSGDEMFAESVMILTGRWLSSGYSADSIVAFSAEAGRQRINVVRRFEKYCETCLKGYKFGDKLPAFPSTYKPAPKKTAPPPGGYFVADRREPTTPYVPFVPNPVLLAMCDPANRPQSSVLGIHESSLKKA